ncbi:hypothetical protein BGW38_001375 [Lunasporangiospora selenospora]|uniref:AMP-binding enzyme C-terminal domain-containing protein n=1 Tax=Lunasporangiospora selenospora TaxID=979761 RepID=A0A9P6FUE8_9FUNG|nr:hypothetical protein BGW38_001375 [Lunasporangiospora selenospora]
MFGHMINPMVTTRSYMNIEPVRLHISLKSLRRGVVQVTTEQEDPTGIWVEDSGIPICGTTVAIVNPETREICLSREIGEIWVSSDSNVQSYQGLAREGRSLSNASPLSVEASNLSEVNKPPATAQTDMNSRYNVTIAGGNTQHSYVRTGEIGFLWNYSKESFNGGKPTSLLFVLGSIGETFEVNGLMHFPKDIEATIEKSHPSIVPSGSIVFQADQAVVCVVQVRQPDVTIVNMPLSIMHQVLEKHHFMPDVIAIVGEGVLTKNRYGEKQRGKMLSLFMSSKMPLLYIHYPRGSPPKSLPEQMQPSAPLTPTMGRLPAPGSPYSPSASSVETKPSSIRSNRSQTSMASMRSVRSFLGTMFNNLKGGHNNGGNISPGHGFGFPSGHQSSGSNGSGNGAYPTGYNHHAHGSTSSISGGLHGSRPGSGSSVGLTSSFTGAMPPTSAAGTPTGSSSFSVASSPTAAKSGPGGEGASARTTSSGSVPLLNESASGAETMTTNVTPLAPLTLSLTPLTLSPVMEDAPVPLMSMTDEGATSTGLLPAVEVTTASGTTKASGAEGADSETGQPTPMPLPIPKVAISVEAPTATMAAETEMAGQGSNILVGTTSVPIESFP